MVGIDRIGAVLGVEKESVRTRRTLAVAWCTVWQQWLCVMMGQQEEKRGKAS
jgi:hypothetical protein